MVVFDKIYNKVIEDLKRGLPPWLTYHNVDHTKYVLQKAVEIAKEENICGRELLLIKTAALYHDTGFLEDRNDHENRGCRIFSEDFNSSEFSSDEKDKICRMILATQVPQKPKTLPEKIVADADLEYLGTENFESFSKNLYREMLHFNPGLNVRQWDEIQIKFLSGHSYHTTYCKLHKAPVKEKNLDIIKERLMAYKSS